MRDAACDQPERIEAVLRAEVRDACRVALRVVLEPAHHEILARLLSLRDAFVALFFVTVGVLIDVRSVLSNLPLLATMVALVVVGKLVLRAAVVWALGQPLSTSLLVGTGLAQIGEFSFVLVQVARSAGHISQDVYQTTLAASLITILLNAALFRAMESWVGRLGLGGRRHRKELAVERAGLRDHVVLCGFGRVGSAIGEALESFGIRYLVIELDPDVIKGLAARGVPCLFGDAGHGRILEHAGVDRAALAVVTVPEADRARLAVQGLRRLRPDLPILARFHDAASRDGLLGAVKITGDVRGGSATRSAALSFLRSASSPTWGVSVAPWRGRRRTQAQPRRCPRWRRW